MEIILKQDVENLGHKDQIVNVKPGYANNFLIPQGFASAATASAKKVLAENIRQRAHKEAKIVADATAVAEKLSAMTVAIATKANEDGKIFGSITTSDVAEAIAKLGVEVDKRNVKVDSIKEVGEYTASVKLYKEIVGVVTIVVSAQE
ncbi:MAG: 50S ribosomal protein L9 [Rikenellaceae bacterium]